jgi:hypothetical protein
MPLSYWAMLTQSVFGTGLESAGSNFRKLGPIVDARIYRR